MCLTLGIWLLLFIGVIAVWAIGDNGDASVWAGLVALGLGVALPVGVNYWRPLILGWPRRRRALQDKLMREGVLTNEDLQKGARLVRMWEVRAGTDRKVPKSRQDAFLLIEGKTLRLLGERSCVNTDDFTVIPSCTGRCSRCGVIWICGGDTFRVRTKVGDQEQDYLIQCREGRTVRATAKATEMLEELVEIEPGAGNV